MESTTPNETSASNALNAISATRAEVAAQVKAPVWYNVAYSLLIAVFVASAALPDDRRPLGVVGLTAGIALLIALYKKQRKVWVSGLTGTRPRLVAISLGVMVVVEYIVVLGLRHTHLAWLSALVVAVAFVSTYTLSLLWQRAFESEA